MAIPKIRSHLSRELRRLRAKHDLTQEKVAEKAGLNFRYYQRLESRIPPAIKIDTLEKLAKVFGIPTWRLLKF